MTAKRKGSIKLWVVLATAVVCWTVGTGFLKDLAASSDETYKGLKLFTDVLEIVTEKYVDEVDTGQLIEKAIQGMVHSLDPHSSLLAPEAYEDLRIDTKGNFTGIGIHITLRDGFVTVISPIEGTPAFKAGIQAQDRIVKVDDTAVEDLRQAVNLMRGPKGTPVKVTVLRKGAPEPIEFDLVRDVIPVKSIKAQSLKPGYGYIWITNFTGNTTEDFLDALEKLESENAPMKGLVLDLRNNPGGVLNGAVGVSDAFLDDGLIVYTEGRIDDSSMKYTATPGDILNGAPLVILVNGGTDGVGEILAAALQRGGAVLVGQRTLGHASYMSLVRDGEVAVWMPVGQWLRPDDEQIGRASCRERV